MKNKAVSSNLYELIKKLNNLKSIKKYDFVLGGGTNLSLRYAHRKSEDIDLFCPGVIGKKGFKEIEKEIKNNFNVLFLTYPLDVNDLKIFMRTLINDGENQVKIELIQNTKREKKAEKLEEIKIMSVYDVGILKLLALADRKTKKDVYDLNYITDEFPLKEIYKGLKEKQKKYTKPEDKSIFEINNKNNPVENLDLLLEFDNYSLPKLGPGHLNDNLTIITGKNWLTVKIEWKNKVRKLKTELTKKRRPRL